jgi:spore coat protein U-like protein
MNKALSAVITATTILAAWANIAWGGTISPTVAVSGAVSGVCRAGSTGSLSFTIDPSLAGPIAATATNATVFCSNGTPFTVTAASTNKGGAAASCASSGGGITGTLKDGASAMDYTFTCGVGGTTGNTGTGQGHGSSRDVNIGIAGSIAAASYANAPVSVSYTDTITLTITY